MRLSHCCQCACRQMRSKAAERWQCHLAEAPACSCLPCALLEFQSVDAVSPHAELVTLHSTMPAEQRPCFGQGVDFVGQRCSVHTCE